MPARGRLSETAPPPQPGHVGLLAHLTERVLQRCFQFADNTCLGLLGSSNVRARLNRIGKPQVPPQHQLRAEACVSFRKMSACSIIIGFSVTTIGAWACSVIKITSNVDLVRQADSIIRAKVMEYAKPPSDPNIWTTGVPDSEVRFEQLEVIRGADVSGLVLPGYLVQRDDFNDQQAPYSFVRPGGRAGSCFANSYRKGAEYLLFLKKMKTGAFTVNWAALAPVNEQLHSSDDSWLIWVREQARKLEKDSKK
jgi:hypothetical protein